MIVLLTSFVALISIILSFHLFKKWFNHISIFSVSWTLFILLYEIQLIRFTPISGETWIIVVFTFLSIWLGAITVFVGRSCFPSLPSNEKILLDTSTGNLNINYPLVSKIAIFFSLLGLIAAIYHWIALINEYGSIAGVFIKANLIYRKRISGESVSTIPYLFVASYIGLFFSSILTAYQKKISIVTILPFLGIILKGMATVGRGGIFLAFLQFVIIFFLYRHHLNSFENKARFNFSRAGLISIISIIILGVGSLTLIKEIRGSIENYEGASRSLRKIENLPVISPQVYFYFSSNIAVLSKYFEAGGEDPPIGANTLLPIYNVLSKFNFVPKQDVYPKGYYVPMWTNAGTFLRDFHADFGYLGLYLIPYLLSLTITYCWFKYYTNRSLYNLLLLSYLYIIISFSIFYMVTRAALWIMSLLALFIIISVLKNKLISKLHS